VLGVAGDAIEVRCGQGALAVTTLQLEGRRMLSAGEFARGQALAGEHFA
jgi:methionyl-tRNA formyltransferase